MVSIDFIDLIARALLQLTPDVFLHPIWVDYITNQPCPGHELCQTIYRSARQFQANGDIPTACQAFILCTALQRHTGDLAAAVGLGFVDRDRVARPGEEVGRR